MHAETIRESTFDALTRRGRVSVVPLPFTTATIRANNVMDMPLTDDTNHQIQLFQGQRVRTVWDADEQKWYFSVVDVVAVLTESADPKQYIKKMRSRDPELDGSWGTICTLTRMQAADGKHYKTQAATVEGIFRIIQSIPSKKAEPFKQWMARVASERAIDHINPEGTLPLNDPEPFAE